MFVFFSKTWNFRYHGSFIWGSWGWAPNMVLKDLPFLGVKTLGVPSLWGWVEPSDNLNMARVMGCHFQNEVAKTDFQLALTLPDPFNIPLWWSQVPCCDGEVHVARNPDGLPPAHEELRPSSPRVMSNWILRTTLWAISRTDTSLFDPRWWQPQPLSWLQLGRDPEYPAVPPRVLIQRNGEKIKSQSLEG